MMTGSGTHCGRITSSRSNTTESGAGRNWVADGFFSRGPLCRSEALWHDGRFQRGHHMNTTLRGAVAAVAISVFASPAFAQPKAKPLPEPLPMGIAYYYKPGNPYWYAPAAPYPSAYPWGAAVPVYGRYEWDYTGRLMGYVHYPYSYQYPTVYGRVWM